MRAKHDGDAGVSARFGRVGEYVALHAAAGYMLGADHVAATREALKLARWSLANRARLREMHARDACSCDGAPHAWGCARRWAE